MTARMNYLRGYTMRLLAALSIFLHSVMFSGILLAQTFTSDPMNADRVRKADGVWDLSIKEGNCNPSDYGDGRGESDCKNGNIQARIFSGKTYNSPNTVSYEFEIFIDEGFVYTETLPYRKRGSIVIAEWGRIRLIKNHMYEMHLTPSRGVTFEGVVCFKPQSYGQWNSVSVIAKWSNADDGILQVKCNDKVIYSQKGPNLVPPGCGTELKPQCKTEYIDLSKAISWKLGPKFYGFGSDYREYGRSSPFLPFPRGGVDVYVRNVKEGKARL